MRDGKAKPLLVNVIRSAETFDFAAWCDRFIALTAKLAEQDMAEQGKANDPR